MPELSCQHPFWEIFTGCLWNFRRLKPYFFVLCVYLVNKIMSLIKVQAYLHMDVQRESQYLSHKSILWFNAFNFMNWLKPKQQAFVGLYLFLVRGHQMVPKIFCKIKHILEAHVKDINFIRERQSTSKIKDIMSHRKGNLSILLVGM